jgi:TonB family protein
MLLVTAFVCLAALPNQTYGEQATVPSNRQSNPHANHGIIDFVAARKAFVRELDDIAVQSKLKKIYVSDFTDESGKFSFLGRFYAATFAGMLDEGSMGFAVIDRAEVRRRLGESGPGNEHSVDPAAIATLVSEMGADAIVLGTTVMNGNAVTLNVVVRTQTGKELAKLRYEENLNGVLRADLEESHSGSVFYTAGIDGVSLPKCVQCPAPDWPTGQGSPGRDGNVVLSILVTLEGNAAQMRVAESLDPVFDKAALECVRSWVFQPAQDADGNPVPVRLPVQVTFKRRWQLR